MPFLLLFLAFRFMYGAACKFVNAAMQNNFADLLPQLCIQTHTMYIYVYALVGSSNKAICRRICLCQMLDILVIFHLFRFAVNVTEPKIFISCTWQR